MVLTEIYDFFAWLPGAALHFVLMAGLLAIAALAIAFLITAFRYGPLAGGDMTFRVAMTAIAELAHTSPRRVWALARLAIQESLRRNVLVALGVFIVVLLFAGWFLDTKSNDPSGLLLSVVLTCITWLSWALAVFLSSFSLPADFKTHTIYTVVTKPVRSGEIVLGRILGFTLIGTALLAIMGVGSYVFALRLLSHSHEIDVASVQTTTQGSNTETTAQTSLAHGHRHQLTIRDGRTTTDVRNNHWHDVAVDNTVRPGDSLVITPKSRDAKLSFSPPPKGDANEKTGSGKKAEPERVRDPERKVSADGTLDLGMFGQPQVAGKTLDEVKAQIDQLVKPQPPDAGLNIDFVPHRADAYTLSGPEGMLLARVPVWGELNFKDRSGRGSLRGISVGKEWTYRSFVEGGTAAAAVWTFHNVTPDRFPDGLPIEMTIRVFRSHKGDINRGISGSLIIKNPQTGRGSREILFTAKDAIIDRHDIPLKLTNSQGEPLDLFKDLAPDGDVDVEVHCLDQGQYFGMAMPDLYLRARDASFEVNLLKSFFGIWLTMVFVISFSVMFSTFLSGPVAMMSTIAVLIVGLFTEDILNLANGITQGGGLFESIIRIYKQQNMTLEMEEGLTRTVVQFVDGVLLFIMKGIALLLPDLSKFDEAFINPVAKGFDISNDAVGVWACRGLAYLCVVFVVGYFFLKTREVAK